ncbi:MAG: protein kinase, partial [Bdellovibrionales bacterium]|nr:protein kinase [Bdellovibrionales bacterium]
LKLASGPKENEDLKDVFHRFEKEARILSSMNHPNIVQCYELTSQNPYGKTYEEQEAPILVLQYVEGIDLYKFGREYEYDYGRIVDIAIQIARALNYAHTLENRVIHRDIKGTNIIINNEGHVYLIDFGISKLGTAVKTTMHRLGTSGFIAPEILENYLASSPKEATQSIDGRADLYSVGCLLYFLVTKKLPFPVKPDLAVTAILLDQRQNKFIPIQKADENCPLILAELIHKLMSYDKDQRHVDAKDLLADLHLVQQKVGLPETQFLDLKDNGGTEPQDYSIMKNEYDVFVRQNNEEKVRYFQSLDTVSEKPSDPSTPPRFDQKFIYSLYSLGALFFAIILYYFFSGGSGPSKPINHSITETPMVKTAPVEINSAEAIKRELNENPTKVVPLNLEKEKTNTNKSAPKRSFTPSQPTIQRSYGDTIDFGDDMTLSSSKNKNRKKTYGVVESNTYSAILVNKIITSDINAPVKAILNEDIIVDGKVIIPAESKIIGTARSSNTDRVSIKFTKFILNNNETISFSGIAMDDQGATGIAGKVDREKSKKVARGGGNVMSNAGGIVLDNVTGSNVGGRILNDAGDEVLDQVDDEVQYHTQSTTVIEVQSGVPFQLYISRSF